jgi:hypothetical protein
MGSKQIRYGGQQPTLIPNTDPVDISPPIMSNGPQIVSFRRIADFEAITPRTPASNAVTFATAPAGGDVITALFTSGVFDGGTYSVSATAVTNDTLAMLVDRVASAINSDPILEGVFGVTAQGGGSAGAVLTINWPGPVGNFAVVTLSSTGATTFTYSPSGGVFSGGAGSVIPYANIIATIGNTCMRLRLGQPYYLDYSTIAALVAGSQPIS